MPLTSGADIPVCLLPESARVGLFPGQFRSIIVLRHAVNRRAGRCSAVWRPAQLIRITVSLILSGDSHASSWFYAH